MNYTAPSLAGQPQVEVDPTAFEAVDSLGLCRLYHRRPTLDGTIPMRGAHCKPFIDGNAAGVHLEFVDPAVLVTASGRPVLQLTDETLNRINVGYRERIRGLADRGLIERNGYWFDRLMEGFATCAGGLLSLWTGWLLRPRTGGILVSRAYNRSCLVNVQEYVITGSRYVPLMLELDGESVYSTETWLDTDLAVLTPIQSGLRISSTEIVNNSAVGARFREFFTADDMAQRAEGRSAARYRDMLSRGDVPLTEADLCRLTTVGPANTVRSRTFDQYRDARGVSRSRPAGTVFGYGVLENSGSVSMRWDGNNLRDIAFDPPDLSKQCCEAWQSVYGEEPGDLLTWWTSYVTPFLGPHRGEPILEMHLHVFAETPVGWSCVVDGYSHSGLPGMRGVIATDALPYAPVAFQIRTVGRLELARGTPLSRVLPVPRRLLRAAFRELSVAEASE